jgi:hypothetical protein
MSFTDDDAEPGKYRRRKRDLLSGRHTPILHLAAGGREQTNVATLLPLALSALMKRDYGNRP